MTIREAKCPCGATYYSTGDALHDRVEHTRWLKTHAKCVQRLSETRSTTPGATP